MKFCVIQQEGGGQYFFDIDDASRVLGITRRTFFENVKRVRVEPSERKRVGQKLYFAESVVSRIWILRRRHGRNTTKSSNGGPTGVVENVIKTRGGGSMNKPIEKNAELKNAEELKAARDFEKKMLAEGKKIRYFGNGTNWVEAAKTMSPEEHEYYRTRIDNQLAVKKRIAEIISKV